MPSDTVTQLGINRRMRGLDRAFEILDFLRTTKKPARPNEIAAGIEAPKSTAYELVNLLLKAGALEYADDDGRVFLGRKLYFLGLVYQQQFDLTRECRAFLARVAEELVVAAAADQCVAASTTDQHVAIPAQATGLERSKAVEERLVVANVPFRERVHLQEIRPVRRNEQVEQQRVLTLETVVADRRLTVVQQ